MGCLYCFPSLNAVLVQSRDLLRRRMCHLDRWSKSVLPHQWNLHQLHLHALHQETIYGMVGEVELPPGSSLRHWGGTLWLGANACLPIHWSVIPCVVGQ